jgi:hypothetical protein
VTPVVPISILCTRCGYDLCGLPVDGDCSECGASVFASIKGRPLLGARHLDRITTAVWCFAFSGLTLPLPLTFVALEMGVTLRRAGVAADSIPWALACFGLFPAVACYVVGWFLVSVPPRRGGQRVSVPFSLSRLWRWVAALTACFAAASLAAAVVFLFVDRASAGGVIALFAAPTLALLGAVGGRYIDLLVPWCGKRGRALAWAGVFGAVPPALFGLLLSCGLPLKFFPAISRAVGPLATNALTTVGVIFLAAAFGAFLIFSIRLLRAAIGIDTGSLELLCRGHDKNSPWHRRTLWR